MYKRALGELTCAHGRARVYGHSFARCQDPDLHEERIESHGIRLEWVEWKG